MARPNRQVMDLFGSS